MTPPDTYAEQAVKVAGDALGLWFEQRQMTSDYRNRYWRVQNERNDLVGAAKAVLAREFGAPERLAAAVERAEGRA